MEILQSALLFMLLGVVGGLLCVGWSFKLLVWGWNVYLSLFMIKWSLEYTIANNSNNERCKLCTNYIVTILH